MMLVTLEDAKARLRIVHDAEDLDLELMIQQASAAVMNYLGLPLNHYATIAAADGSSSNGYGTESSSDSDSDAGLFESSSEGAVTPVKIPAEVELATLLLVGILARDRDGVEMKDWEQGYLPKPVLAFLYPLRDPVMG